MFKAEDFVQSKTGGPKCRCCASKATPYGVHALMMRREKEIEVKAESVNLYHEEGDFGVC